MAQIAVIFADGFEEIEAVAIVDVLRRAEFTVLQTGLTGPSVNGAHDIRIEMNTVLAELALEQLDAVVLPGGMPGSANLAGSTELRTLLQDAAAAGKVVAAICAAPWALAEAGLLEGKTVTCYPAFRDKLRGARYTGGRVEVDGRIVTGAGPGAAIEFALALVTELGQPAKAGQLHQGMIVG